MQEFIDKLIERLEEREVQAYAKMDGGVTYQAYRNAIEIVIELAEEYKVSEIPTGWIPCSERLPEGRGWYLAVFQEGDSDFVLVPRVADYIGKETVCTTNEGWLIIDLEDEMGINAYYKNLICIAWQPLPAPYTEGE